MVALGPNVAYQLRTDLTLGSRACTEILARFLVFPDVTGWGPFRLILLAQFSIHGLVVTGIIFTVHTPSPSIGSICRAITPCGIVAQALPALLVLSCLFARHNYAGGIRRGRNPCVTGKGLRRGRNPRVTGKRHRR